MPTQDLSDLLRTQTLRWASRQTLRLQFFGIIDAGGPRDRAEKHS